MCESPIALLHLLECVCVVATADGAQTTQVKMIQCIGVKSDPGRMKTSNFSSVGDLVHVEPHLTLRATDHELLWEDTVPPP